MTTPADLIKLAFKDVGAWETGQPIQAEDENDGFNRLNFMLALWARKRYLVYHLVEVVFTATGALSYTVGPGQNFDTGAGSSRPDSIEYAFARMVNTSVPNQGDYPLRELQSREDYSLIGLKRQGTFPEYYFYDPAYPNGSVFFWPLPQASIYEMHIGVKQPLVAFANLAQQINLPPEYMDPLIANLAIRLWPSYRTGVQLDPALVAAAKDGLATLRKMNSRVPRLQLPAELTGGSRYDIISDRMG